MKNAGNMKEEGLWIVKWNQFLCVLKKTIEDEEENTSLIEMQDLAQIEGIREFIDFRKLYSYLKEHQINHARAWIFRFERSMNEVLKFALSRFNCPHDKELEYMVVDKYEYDIEFINEERDKLSKEEMRDIPDTLEEMQKFYQEYKIRVSDYEANCEYRKKYFAIRKGIELIPKESLLIKISPEGKAYIYVSKENKNMFDKLLKDIDVEWESYELNEIDFYYDKKLRDYDVEFVYERISYYDFQNDASLSEAIYEQGYDSFTVERAIMDAFEDDNRIIKYTFV